MTNLNCVCIVFAISLMLAGHIPARAAEASSTDWPQYQHDAARSGYTPVGPTPPFREAWTYDFLQQHDKIHPVVQAIVYAGKVFVPSRGGRIFAVDVASGKLAWKREGFGPLVNTVGCADGKVFFGSLDGNVYAIRASDGEPVWKTYAQIRGFCAAPCLAHGSVFIGGRNGTFYCLDQQTGNIRWQRDTGGFIYQTAACANGKVYFANEAMKMICLEAQSGAVQWETGRLIGITFMDSHAFADQGKVVVRGWNGGITMPMDIPKEAVAKATAEGKFASVPDSEQDKIAELLRKEPERRQMMHVFDAQTGAIPYVPIHTNVSTVDGPSFSTCSDGRGHWVVSVALAYNWSKPQESISPQTFARIDPATGRLLDLVWTPDCKPASTDEANAFSVGGNILYCSEQEEGEAGIFIAFDLDAAKAIHIPLGKFYSTHWTFEYNHQPLCNPIAIAGDRFYKVTDHELRCWMGTTAAAR